MANETVGRGFVSAVEASANMRNAGKAVSNMIREAVDRECDPGTVQDRGGIGAAFERLDRMASLLEEQIKRASDRISPVLRCGAVENRETVARGGPGDSAPLAVGLERTADRIDAATRALSDLLDRVDL